MEMKGEKIDSEKLLSYSNWQLIRDIGSYLKPYRWRFFFASLLRFYELWNKQKL